MKPGKKILLVLLIVFTIIQFIQPDHNTSQQVLQADITKIYAVPDSVLHVIKIACYDCHSNNTKYPLYNYVQPIGWFLASHIKDGKAELNFNEFGNYSQRRQSSKFKAIANSLKDGTMPISSYTFMHTEAMLSKEKKQLIMKWAFETANSLKKN